MRQVDQAGVSGQRDRMTPFIVPTNASWVPKSVVSVTIEYTNQAA